MVNPKKEIYNTDKELKARLSHHRLAEKLRPQKKEVNS